MTTQSIRKSILLPRQCCAGWGPDPDDWCEECMEMPRGCTCTRCLERLGRRIVRLLRHGPAGNGEITHHELCHQLGEKYFYGALVHVANQDAKGRILINRTHIAASQGHTTVVPCGRVFTLGDGTEYPLATHATTSACADQIMREGLKPGRRRHVHMLPGGIGPWWDNRFPARHSEVVTILVDLARFERAGGTFVVSQNGYLLTSEVIPPHFLKRETPVKRFVSHAEHCH